ncbi:hypothetical protein L218DRAFT_1073080 [Marasmius fiardii PR-910]|nr:hypothetical protein L218DRAFT_1073080 [Marasmius fiardii PR-910]
MYRDTEKLKNLKRTELQQIAAQEGIKGNQKSAVIIQQLLAKYPEGIPRKGTPKKSKTSRLSTAGSVVSRSSAKNEEGDNNSAESSSRLRVRPRRLERQEHDNLETESQGELDSLLRLCFKTTSALPGGSRRGSTLPGDITEQRDPEEQWKEVMSQGGHEERPLKRARISDHTVVIGTPQRAQKNPRPNPSSKDVRYVLRAMRENVDYLAEMQRSIEKTAALLEEAKEQTESIQAEIKEMVCLRWHIEEAIVKKVKKDKFLIDGTTALGSQSTQGAAWRKWQAEQQEMAED